MKNMIHTVNYGKTKIDYDLRMMNRKTLEIAVHPDTSVVIKAPFGSTLAAIENKIKKRARWIRRQIAYFNQFDPKTPERNYLGGESHLYLGRKYRLKIQISDREKILLKNGYFYIESKSDNPEHIKKQVRSWYKKRAEIYLAKVFDDCWKDFKKGDLSKPSLKIQSMNKRWGSLSGKGQLTLNLNLIQTPKACIEYVVIHEFCHLIHNNHGAEFYKLLDRTIPDWMKRKQKLEMALI